MSEIVPTVIGSETAYAGRVLQVRRDTIAGDSGLPRVRDVVVHPDCVCGIARMPNGHIALVRQYRHPVGGYLWELPAGKIDPGESPRQAFERELAEECGLGCDSVTEACSFFTSPGILTERMHLFVADGCHEGAGKVNPGEIARWKAVPLEEALEMIARGDIVDGKSIVGIAYAARGGQP